MMMSDVGQLSTSIEIHQSSVDCGLSSVTLAGERLSSDRKNKKCASSLVIILYGNSKYLLYKQTVPIKYSENEMERLGLNLKFENNVIPFGCVISK